MFRVCRKREKIAKPCSSPVIGKIVTLIREATNSNKEVHLNCYMAKHTIRRLEEFLCHKVKA